jgi:hypothetical protein
LALAVSAGLYVAARVFGLNLPNWPEAGGWFFNPLAWQLVFTLGLVSAVLGRDGPRPAPWLLTLSTALTVTNDGGLAPGLRDTATAHLDVAKQDLGLARLVHFIALAYLVRRRQASGGSSAR